MPYERRMSTFSHIFSGAYAAGYYSYPWAEALSADWYQALCKGDMKEMGMRFRATVLGLGGGVDPLTVFQTFVGEERGLNPESLLKSYDLI